VKRKKIERQADTET
jgi:hypothetical protein